MRLICICNFVYRISNLRDFASRVGIAYRWLQRICGLQFLDNAPAASATSNDSEAPAMSDVSNDNNLEMTVRKIRRRVVTRVSLCRQLLAFGSNVTSHFDIFHQSPPQTSPSLNHVILPTVSEQRSVAIQNDFQHLFPTKISASLASWQRSTYEDYVVSCLTSVFLTTFFLVNTLDAHSYVFRTVHSRVTSSSWTVFDRLTCFSSPKSIEDRVSSF